MWLFLRLLVATLIAIHGWARLLENAVTPFGQWLNTQGFAPAGPAIAWGITGFEIGGTLLLALGRFTRPLALLYACIYAVGIILVHAPAGWFVVGLGRNGAEYSVLLIGVLLAIALQKP